MAATVDDLAADLQRFFATRFPGGDNGPGSVVLVFDQLGRPIPDAELVGAGGGVAADVLAHQWAAQTADGVPAANQLRAGAFLTVDGSRLSRWYERILKAATPIARDKPGLQAFAQARADALELLEPSRRAVVSGTLIGGPAGTSGASGVIDDYLATGMTPVGWFLEGATSWQTYEYDAADHPSGSAPPPPQSGGSGVRSPWPIEIRVVKEGADPKLVQYATTGEIAPFRLELPEHAIAGDWDKLPVSTGINRGTRIERGPVIAGGTRIDRGTKIGRGTSIDRGTGIGSIPGLERPSAIHVATRAAHATLAHADVGGAEKVLVPGVFPTGAVLAATVAHPPTSDRFRVRFEYQHVQFSRPWWDGFFLGRDDWRIPGYDPGEICTGSASLPSPMVSLMVVGMLVVRNLSISASWSEQDKQRLGRAVSLGPFSLAGDDYDAASGSIGHVGKQAIGWVCQVPPPLPPRH